MRQKPTSLAIMKRMDLSREAFLPRGFFHVCCRRFIRRSTKRESTSNFFFNKNKYVSSKIINLIYFLKKIYYPLLLSTIMQYPTSKSPLYFVLFIPTICRNNKSLLDSAIKEIKYFN